MKMDRKKAIIIAIILLTSTTLAVGAQQGWFGFIFEPILETPDVSLKHNFTLSAIPEWFASDVVITGSGYTGEEHGVSLDIWQTRPDNGIWEADGSYSLSLEDSLGALVEDIDSGTFTALRPLPDMFSRTLTWTPLADPDDYFVALSISDVSWVQVYMITASAGTGGSITPSGEVPVVKGSIQGFTITADAGYAISDVLVNSVSVGAVQFYGFINVQSDQTIEAVFAQTYTITATAGTGGSIAPPGATTVLHGQSQEYTITPDSGYVIDDVLVDSITSLGPVSSYLFEDVTADHTIHASFVQTVAEYSSGYTYVERGGVWTVNSATYDGDANHIYLGGETINYVVNAKNAGVAFTELTYDVRVKIHDGTYVTLLTGETNTYGTPVVTQNDFTITGSFVQPSGESGYWDLLIQITGISTP